MSASTEIETTKRSAQPQFGGARAVRSCGVLSDGGPWSRHFHVFKEVRHFCSGRRCRCGFLYQKRQGQSLRRFQAGQGSCRRDIGARRVFWRRLLDRTAEAFGHRVCNDGMRGDAGGRSWKFNESFSVNPNFRTCLSHISWRGTLGWRKTSSISFLTQPRSGWRGCCCCWPISERKAERANSCKDQSGDTR